MADKHFTGEYTASIQMNENIEATKEVSIF